MKPSDDRSADFVRAEWLPTALCSLFAVPIGWMGLLAALLQMLVNMNLSFARPAHCIIFSVGWLTAACCIYSAYRLVRYSSYRSLGWVLIAGAMLALDFWLYSLPSARGLIH